MAHGLELTIVAEGVETEEQLAFLQQHNCHQVQGYIFSRAVPVDDFTALLRQGVLIADEEHVHYKNGNKSKDIESRVYFPLPLQSQMTIVKIKDKYINLAKTDVLITDIGCNDLHFQTNLNLPVNREIILQIETELLDKSFHFKGHIVWKDEEEINEYELVFEMREKERNILTRYLQQYKDDSKVKMS